MIQYFDRTFFKFLFGFLFILALSFLALFFTQYLLPDESLDTRDVENTIEP